MRPTRLALLSLGAVISLAACSAGESPGWTYAPAPPATPTPSASGEPSAMPSGEPTETPPGAPAVTLELVASGIAYDKRELTAPAGEPFAIHLVNEDPPGVPHDVDIEQDDGTVLQNTDVIDGGQEVTYTYEPLEAGEYVFQCSIHPIPAMTGTLIVE